MKRSDVRRWMRRAWETDGYNTATELAERAAEAFACDYEGGPLDDEEHWIWDMAEKIATERWDAAQEAFQYNQI
jgi:hypothetical protein